ncbi:hypothetical protein CKAH01_12096 [Colletotrichum kahawae]|uniref:Uncharacterized protein n=1 Tax=Colletotrichum kahawae TaxID=34407 RepID=A0AAD9YTH1_COLKA|nr:hypothetical protein CKAH01_12096 [Colletotrichum kahawae]
MPAHQGTSRRRCDLFRYLQSEGLPSDRRSLSKQKRTKQQTTSRRDNIKSIRAPKEPSEDDQFNLHTGNTRRDDLQACQTGSDERLFSTTSSCIWIL